MLCLVMMINVAEVGYLAIKLAIHTTCKWYKGLLTTEYCIRLRENNLRDAKLPTCLKDFEAAYVTSPHFKGTCIFLFIPKQDIYLCHQRLVAVRVLENSAFTYMQSTTVNSALQIYFVTIPSYVFYLCLFS